MEQLTKDVIQWIKDYFKDNSDGKVICGISGGKDSTVVAALCKEALGADRVMGVLMPNGAQSDIEDSFKVCEYLGIEYQIVNIRSAYLDILCSMFPRNRHNFSDLPPAVSTNLPSRLRMCVLYTIAAIYPNSRVVNTSNFSERYIGYSTKFGDGAGDFSPLGNLTVREVLMIGDDLGLPHELVHKTPSDGMSGQSDEERIGFTYDELDDYLMRSKVANASTFYSQTYSRKTIDTMEKIEKMHAMNKHKMNPMPMYYRFNNNEEDYK